MSVTGQCLCGAASYEFDALPIMTRICWCRVCQKIAAGNATVNVGFASSTMRLRGELRDYVSIADSGNVMHRRFCPTCGIHVFTASEARADRVFVRAGTLDDAGLVQPAATIWVSSAPAWAPIDPDLPRFDRQPPPVA